MRDVLPQIQKHNPEIPRICCISGLKGGETVRKQTTLPRICAAALSAVLTGTFWLSCAADAEADDGTELTASSAPADDLYELHFERRSRSRVRTLPI